MGAVKSVIVLPIFCFFVYKSVFVALKISAPTSLGHEYAHFAVTCQVPSAQSAFSFTVSLLGVVSHDTHPQKPSGLLVTGMATYTFTQLPSSLSLSLSLPLSLSLSLTHTHTCTHTHTHTAIFMPSLSLINQKVDNFNIGA